MRLFGLDLVIVLVLGFGLDTVTYSVLKKYFEVGLLEALLKCLFIPLCAASIYQPLFVLNGCQSRHPVSFLAATLKSFLFWVHAAEPKEV